MMHRLGCSSWGPDASSPASPFSAGATGDLNSSGAGVSQPHRGPRARAVSRAICSKAVFCMAFICSVVEGSQVFRQLPVETGSNGRALSGERLWGGG